jgi:hypothetical protein
MFPAKTANFDQRSSFTALATIFSMKNISSPFVEEPQISSHYVPLMSIKEVFWGKKTWKERFILVIEQRPNFPPKILCSNLWRQAKPVASLNVSKQVEQEMGFVMLRRGAQSSTALRRRVLRDNEVEI